jgi:hypothetical protein
VILSRWESIAMGSAMMGRLEAGQERLFYHFRLEDQVPANHLLRRLDALLDFDVVRKQLEPFYSEIGRPSVDPELMIRMLLIGYCYSTVPSGDCATRSGSTSLTDGSAGLASKRRCRTIRRSRSTAMAASVRARRFGGCSRAWWRRA